MSEKKITESVPAGERGVCGHGGLLPASVFV